MKKRIFFIIPAIMAILLFFSCYKAQEDSVFSENTYEMGMDSVRSESIPHATMKQTAPASVNMSTNGFNSTEEQNVKVNDRKLIQTARIRVSTAKAVELRDQIQTKIAEYSGFIENSYQSSTPEQVVTSIDMTVKIPAEKLANFLTYIDSNAKVLEKSLQTQDVTDRYYDLEARVKNRQILLDTYRAYLESAKVMKDILDVDDRINSLTYEIEQMKGSLISLDRSIQYSTINLSIVNSDVSTPSPYSFIMRIKELGTNITDFFISALFTVIYVAIIGTALVLLAALVFYLTFGKLGLVRKLFKKLK